MTKEAEEGGEKENTQNNLLEIFDLLALFVILE